MLFSPSFTVLLYVSLFSGTTFAIPPHTASDPAGIRPRSPLPLPQQNDSPSPSAPPSPPRPPPLLWPNCKGSGGCLALVNQVDCIDAYMQFERERSYDRYTSFQEARCTAVYRCEDPDEYGTDAYGTKSEAGLSGIVIRDMLDSLYTKYDCRFCGSVHWGKDLALAPFRAATSRPARRIYISTFLFASTSSVLLGLAVLAYGLFYVNYVPRIGLERVIHLQFGDGYPYGTLDLGGDLISQQAYDVTVFLDLPRSPPNLAAGNFMLDLALLSPASTTTAALPPAESDVLLRSRRPAILTYTSPLVDSVNRAAALPWLVSGWRRESEKVDVRMMEGVEFARGWRNVPRKLRLEIQSAEKMAVYHARIRFIARLTGMRWIMYNHRILSLILFTTLFYLTSLLWAALAWLAFSLYTSSSPSSTRPSSTIKPDPDAPTASDTTTAAPSSTPFIKSEPSDLDTEDDLDLSDTQRSFPTFSRQPPLRYTGPSSSSSLRRQIDPSVEAEIARTTGIQPLGGEEGEVVQGSRGGGARRADSGIGTSLEEGGSSAGGVQRRRSGKGRGG
ncbi:MAG: hypothetical protein M1817_002987 [Caeruleum heppii]|nr:MAG: hypothetical protein M1817_002987 [Caeruleum heppii]